MSVTATAISVVMNIIFFGGVIYGALSKRYSGLKLIAVALGVPATFNVLICLWKTNLSAEQRLVGFVATICCVLLIGFFLRRHQLAKAVAHG